MIQQSHSWAYIQKRQKALFRKDTCTPMFTGALFTIPKTWKQPQGPSTNEWIKMWCVCVCIYVYIYTFFFFFKPEGCLCLVMVVTLFSVGLFVFCEHKKLWIII